MKKELNPNYKPNKIHLELMSKLNILESFANKGLIYIDEEKGLLLIREEVFVSVCNTPERYKAFLNNVLLWMSFERSRKETMKYTREELQSMPTPPLPPDKPFDVNVISERGKCLVVGQYDGTDFKMVPYEKRKKEVLQEAFAHEA